MLTRFFVLAINILLAMLLGIALAYWSWQVWELSSPNRTAPQDIQTTRPSFDVTTELRTSWFGGGVREADLPRAGDGLRLVGIFAASQSQPSYALITIDGGRSVTLAEGGELLAGVSIHEIFPNHITLKRNGVVERLDLNRPPPPQGLIVPLNRPAGASLTSSSTQ